MLSPQPCMQLHATRKSCLHACRERHMWSPGIPGHSLANGITHVAKSACYAQRLVSCMSIYSSRKYLSETGAASEAGLVAVPPLSGLKWVARSLASQVARVANFDLSS
eukprot:jgi/Ulvmu1/11298/UM074_0013.1